MSRFLILWQHLAHRYNLDEHRDRLRQWLRRDEYRKQRRIVTALSCFALTVIIVLMTECSGGPEIHP